MRFQLGRLDFIIRQQIIKIDLIKVSNGKKQMVAEPIQGRNLVIIHHIEIVLMIYNEYNLHV